MANAKTDFSISVNVKPDTSNVQKTFDELQQSASRKALKIPLDLKIDDIVPKLDSVLNNKIGRKVDASFDRINTKFQTVIHNITQEVEKIGANGQIEKKLISIPEKLTKVTETFKNKVGDVQERVSIWDEKNKYLASSLNTIKNGIKGIVTETNTSIEKMGNFDAKVTKVTETIRDTNNQTKQVITKTTEWVDAQGKLNQQIEKTDKNGNQLGSVIVNISNDAKKATKLINDLNTAVSNINKNDVKRTETRTFIDANGVQKVTEYANGIKVLTTETRQYINTNRELVTETRVLEGEEEKLVSVNEQKIRNIQQEQQAEREQLNARFNLREETARLREEEERLNNALVSTTTTQSRGLITQFGDTSGREYEALITTIERVNEAGQRVIQTTYEFTNAQGQLVRQTRTTDAENNKLAEDTIEIINANERAIETNNRLAQSTNNVTNAQNQMGGALGRALKTLTQYYVASLPIRAVQTAITETISTLKEFDDALIEFKKVSDLAGESLTNYVSKLAEIGKATGSTMTAMVDAATQFRKSGFNDDDSATLASLAEKFRNVADEEISAADSASFIIAQMKAFNIEAGNAEHILDAVNEV